MRTFLSSLLSAFRGNKAVHQRHPDLSEHEVERIVRRDFPEQFDVVMLVLSEYASGRFPRECSRVQMSALRLAQGDLKALRRHIADAERDYRDVLAAAEYPEYMRAGSRLPTLSREEQRRIVKSDWEQYQKWLQR